MVLRRVAFAFVLALATSTAISCGGGKPAGTPAKLRVVAVPESASVYVDDRFVATARRLARRPHTLAPGPHQVTLKAQGYFPHDITMDLPAGTTTLRIKLRPIPP